jgi:predicted RNA binding protein YcfA (HicA-like mRNA interferase family)
MTTLEIIRFLEANGFIKSGGGRHQIHMTKGNLSVPITSHPGDVPKGTVNSILREAGYSMADAKKWKERG